ncbi:hypothetical protein XELAEV_18039525mg [Xenopus laevis]|uniref:Uncharacterized protein n=1 Tax=Xenopus laevis TaxID=8355 RepID=A0A974C7Z3_XENLA|nr:hypothetical protein XELAEV_18039525mg [Xenopus laevis]
MFCIHAIGQLLITDRSSAGSRSVVFACTVAKMIRTIASLLVYLSVSDIITCNVWRLHLTPLCQRGLHQFEVVCLYSADK